MTLAARRIFITGTAGFTGRHLLGVLARAGHDLHGMVRSDPEAGGIFTPHVCDLHDAPALARLITRVRPHQVVHLAAVAFPAHHDVDAMYRTNVLGTRHLLEALAASPHKPDAVLLASSASVYGNSTEGRLDESAPLAPANDYAVTKVAMEYIARLYASRLPIVVARSFNYTGVGQTAEFLIPKIVAHARARAPRIELGNLDVARDFSDARTVAECYARLLDTPGAIGQTVNVCSGVTYTLHEVLRIVSELSGHRMEVAVNPAFVRANEVKLSWGNRSKLDAVVGVVPAIPLRETLSWMLAA